MNEERLQSYLTLTQQLLNFTTEEELSATLDKNRDLLDAGFLDFLNQHATLLAEQGEEETACGVTNLAERLAGASGMTESELDLQGYLDFLETVLQAEYESNEPNAIYPILEKNLDKLNLTFAELLQKWARKVFANSSQEETETIAGVIGNFCIDIQEFPLGNRSYNREIAIAGYEVVLEIYTREAFPVEHAMTLYNLALVYIDRIQGDRAENLEKVIELYTEALKIRTREAFPIEHARTLNNLANAYKNRLREDRAENLEKAITDYRSALAVFTYESFPYQWGSTTYNLGVALNERFDRLGEREDLEEAIDAFEKIMKFYEKHPDEKFNLARTRSALGHALFQQGNYTRAIEILERARLEWQDLKDIANLAATLFDLGRLYHLQGFLEQARLYYKDSSRLFRRTGDKTKEFAIMVALGNLSMQTGRISDAENYLTRAKQYYEEEKNVVRLQEIQKLLDFIPKDYAGFTKI
ncbi:tetratricopeptide repeat protein [Pannus brasiliensis CCIBt3594]|uniref:Tetratricopeptide repeat protein n=1 Tax=Pannus brasiliensis CCIBt3594 TaxID=1427578 RepID=A0AAW9QMR0_9CHRO